MVWSDKRETGIFFSFLFIWLKKPEESDADKRRTKRKLQGKKRS